MDSKKRVFTVLLIDGGGVRGIVPARILQEIEEKTGKPVTELFDLIGGTSTGAIIATGLTAPHPQDPTKPKFSAKEVCEFYRTLSQKVFPVMRFRAIRQLSGGTLYDPKPFEDSLQEKLGDLKMGDCLNSLMIPVTDIKAFRPKWITHLKGQKDASTEGWDSMLLRDAVRVSTTVPTIFPAKYVETTPNESMPHVKHRHALVDGGFFAGSAMLKLLTTAKRIAPPDAEIILVHLGTGYIDNSLSPAEFNKLLPMGMLNKDDRATILSLVTDLSLREVEADIREEIGDRLFSLNGVIDPDDNPESPSHSMDDAQPENLRRLEKFAEGLLRENADEIDRLCSVLKNRALAEEVHLESETALQALVEKMAGTKTVRSLTHLHAKIVAYSSGIEPETPEKDDAEIKTFAEKLNDYHKAEIDRIYHVMLENKQRQSKIINSIKEAGEDITDAAKKILIDPFKNDPPANDDKKPPAHKMG